MNKTKIALLVFVLVSLLDIIGIIFQRPELRYLFKPLILLSLIVLYTFSSRERNKVYIMALLFSFFGDVFLLFSGGMYFILGLISFLIAHLLFIKIIISRIKTLSFLKIIKSSIPFLILFSLLIFTLKNSLGELLIPVIIYGLTIAAFGTVSLIDFLNTNSKKSLFMLVGAVVFTVSDSILAINKFYLELLIFQVLVMVTYVLAQYYIYKSMVIIEKD